jgi:hypothetical protein
VSVSGFAVGTVIVATTDSVAERSAPAIGGMTGRSLDDGPPRSTDG